LRELRATGAPHFLEMPGAVLAPEEKLNKIVDS